jgi:hypothetical protein
MSHPNSYSFITELSIMAKQTGAFLQIGFETTKQGIPNEFRVLINVYSVFLVGEGGTLLL